MDRSERDALDRHITGNYGEDQLRDASGGDGQDDSGPEEPTAARTYHSDLLGAVTIPEDEDSDIDPESRPDAGWRPDPPEPDLDPEADPGL